MIFIRLKPQDRNNVFNEKYQENQGLVGRQKKNIGKAGTSAFLEQLSGKRPLRSSTKVISIHVMEIGWPNLVERVLLVVATALKTGEPMTSAAEDQIDFN